MTISLSSNVGVRWWRRAAWLLVVAVFACAAEYEDVGQYRVVTATDGFFGLRCQPRTEFYLLDRSPTGTKPVYLGTCSTPRFVTEHMHMPGDPSCFAVSEEGDALVYFHRPNWCGAGDKARRKPGGVYRHSEASGDTLLYSEEQVGQIWSRVDLEPRSIRVAWRGAEPSRGGAVCSQNLIIKADGSEVPEGEPRTIHGCPPGSSNTPSPDR